MTQILIDAVTNISLHSGVLRIECSAVGADGQPHPSGTIIIPAAAAMSVLQALMTGTQELDKKLREQLPTAGSA